ncbi:uncharacterized protein [Amphiura filiformis]|uniref:uncharacterized protein n=1 Tax=Amphiura filiformis TaxID=82378 RepID=UPI003B228A9A
MNLTDATNLPNSQLDALLQKFYCGSRQQNGTLYCKKSMMAIRFGIQRHFLNTKKVDVVYHDDFANSSRVFKCFSATLKQKGKGVVTHKEAISAEDMAIIQESLELSDPLGLQDKVILDVMLYFCNRGRENLREMTRDSFEISEEGGKQKITLKDTLTKNNRGDDQEKSQGGVMLSTGIGPRCPVNTFLLYMDKLNPGCECFWQKPKPKAKSAASVWYCNAPLGKNKIGSKMKDISLRAGTARSYTNHCLRATSVSSLQNAGFKDRDIMTVCGHHSETSIKHYARTTEDTKHKMSEAIAATMSIGPPAEEPSSSKPTQSNSQEIAELEQIMRDISNNPDVMTVPVNITSSSTTNST